MVAVSLSFAIGFPKDTANCRLNVCLIALANSCGIRIWRRFWFRS